MDGDSSRQEEPSTITPVDDDREADDVSVSPEQARTAVDALDRDDPDWEALQWFLADGLHERFLEAEDPDPSDLEEAVWRARTVVTAQGETSGAHDLDFSIILWTQFETTRQQPVLAEYIALLERTHRMLTAQDDPDGLLGACMCNLATGLNTRSTISPSLEDRSRARALWEAAAASGLLDEEERRGVLANLAQSLSGADATEAELVDAVAHGRAAVGLRPNAESTDDESSSAVSEDPHTWLSLGNALDGLQAMRSELGLLDQAIDATAHGLDLVGEDHEDHPGYAANLAGLLRQRARRTGDRDDLLQARGIVGAALQRATGSTHPDRVHILLTAGAVLSDLAYTDDDGDLMRAALSHYRAAADSTVDGADEGGVVSANLSAVLREAADLLVDPTLIDEAIGYGERALRAFSAPSLGRAAALTSTGNALRDRFVASGDLGDLDRALVLAREAVRLTPSEHYEYPARQTNLAVLLSDNYTERAVRADLDEAIGLYRDALRFPETSDSRVAERRNDLALALKDRHGEADTLDDLNESIELGAAVVAAVPRESFAWAGWASNYGNALAERYELLGDVDDLDAAIDLFAKASDSAQDRVVEASGYTNNLGLALAARAAATDDVVDLDLALFRLADAVRLLPDGHPDVCLRSSNLADIYRVRSVTRLDRGDRPGAVEDARRAVDEARSAVRMARSVAGSSEARALPPLSNLARALRWLSSLDTGVDRAEILSAQREAANLPHITPAERFSQSAQWAEDAEQAGDLEQTARAYRHAVDATTEVAWIGLTQHERLVLLELMSTVTARAVASFIRLGEYWEAIATADHIRSVVWRQDLLVREVEDVPRASLMSALRGGPGTEAVVDASRQHEREMRRQVAHQAAPRLQLPRRQVSDYATMSIPGALILLVPGEETSLALVICDGCAPLTIDLPLAGSIPLSERVQVLREAVKGPTGDQASWTVRDERAMRHRVFDVLQWLWDTVARPILDALGEIGGVPARIWWSPLGDFALVPVHAAGRHPRSRLHRTTGLFEGSCLADHAASSYLPIVFNDRREAETRDETILYVSAGLGTDEPSAAAAELESLTGPFGAAITPLIGLDATVENVRRALPHHRHLHIAAHGHLHESDSLQSGIALADGRLTLSTLAACDTGGGGMAMILSCDSAAGAVNSPNETLHVAGAAIAAGYRNVIAATMPLRDSHTRPVVSAVYAALAHDPATRSTDAAQALHTAVNGIRLDPETCSDPLTWAPYAHFGWTDD